jgi:hypothetical protein
MIPSSIFFIVPLPPSHSKHTARSEGPGLETPEPTLYKGKMRATAFCEGSFQVKEGKTGRIRRGYPLYFIDLYLSGLEELSL